MKVTSSNSTPPMLCQHLHLGAGRACRSCTSSAIKRGSRALMVYFRLGLTALFALSVHLLLHHRLGHNGPCVGGP